MTLRILCPSVIPSRLAKELPISLFLFVASSGEIRVFRHMTSSVDPVLSARASHAKMGILYDGSDG